MLCLHGKPAVTSTTDKGTFWFCGEPFSCNLICREEDEPLYGEAVQTFLKTGQQRPVCCGIENSDDRHYARLRVVKDTSKTSYGRPFFVCPKDQDPCRYFEWGDKIIEEKPLCRHGKPCIVRKVKKAGKNKGRSFLCCAERREDDCHFFEWSNLTQKQPLDDPSSDDEMEERKKREKQELKRQILNSFFEGLTPSEECKTGNCGHIDCYELSRKDNKEYLEYLEHFQDCLKAHKVNKGQYYPPPLTVAEVFDKYQTQPPTEQDWSYMQEELQAAQEAERMRRVIEEETDSGVETVNGAIY